MIDFALVAGGGEGEEVLKCASFDPAHQCFDMADVARNGIVGMEQVLDRNFFDHDLVLHKASLTVDNSKNIQVSTQETL